MGKEVEGTDISRGTRVGGFGCSDDAEGGQCGEYFEGNGEVAKAGVGCGVWGSFWDMGWGTRDKIVDLAGEVEE